MESLFHTRTPLSFASTIYQDRELTEIEILEVLDITDSFIENAKSKGVNTLYAIASASLSRRSPALQAAALTAMRRSAR